MSSGYYWGFLLKDDGEPLYDSPEIVWYSSERNAITIIGYDLECDPANYRLLNKVEYKPEILNG